VQITKDLNPPDILQFHSESENLLSCNMQNQALGIRPFIGAKNYDLSRAFYRDFGFKENEVSPNMCVYAMNRQTVFYLQKAYVKDWVENTMLFLEVENTEAFREELLKKDLVLKYPGVRISEVKQDTWGREFFVHDPSTILWHIGEFNK